MRTRERDFGITDALAARPAGAVAFLNVLRHDLIPLIDSTYRTTPDRGLVGIEQAGVFAIYTLLHEADLFQRYIIGSPAIDLGPDWADPSTFKWEAEYAASHRDLAARVYMFVGGGVDTWATLSRPPAEQFWSRLKARRYANLDLTTEVFSREGISSVNLPAMDRALRAIYNPRSVSLGDAARRSYVGDWRSDSGDVITLRLVDNHLVLFVPPVRRLRNSPKQILASELSAETDTSFFGRGSSLERMTSLVFHRESKAGPATSLVLRRAGAKPVVYRRVRVK